MGSDPGLARDNACPAISWRVPAIDRVHAGLPPLRGLGTMGTILASWNDSSMQLLRGFLRLNGEGYPDKPSAQEMR